MVPTRRFWALVAIGIPIAALATIAGSPVLAIIYDLLLIAAALVTVRLAPSSSNLRLKRKYDSVLSVRSWNKIVLQIENDGIEVIDLVMRDEPPPSFEATNKEFPLKIAPGELKEVSYSLKPQERGSDTFRGTAVRIKCPLGLALKQSWLPTEEPVRIYPNILALREFDLLKQRGRLRDIGIRRSRTRGLGTEFESIRQYTEGDDYRKIDWKATARKGDIMVRQYEQERNQSVLICIDIGRHMLSEVNGVRKLDHVLDSILMLANAASLAGDLVGLLVYSDVVRRFIPPRKGRNQLGLIIEACHDLVAEPAESDLVAAMSYLSQRWKRRSLVVTFTDCEDPDRAQELLIGFLPVARRHLSLLCRVLDPRMDEVERLSIDSVKDMYAKAAATMLMEDRKTAGALIVASGVHILDSEPQDLAANLVSYYFTIKERSLL